MDRGMVHVYTGDGKGKTTAAFGLAMRAVGRGLRVYIIQFMKSQEYGEVRAAGSLGNLITIYMAGRSTHVNLHNPDPADVEWAGQGLALARDAIASGQYDVAILDEVNIALYARLLRLEDVLSLVRDKPPSVELILTGRYAPEGLIEAADLVTEMREVKHYYRQGVLSREGIDV